MGEGKVGGICVCVKGVVGHVVFVSVGGKKTNIVMHFYCCYIKVLCVPLRARPLAN